MLLCVERSVFFHEIINSYCLKSFPEFFETSRGIEIFHTILNFDVGLKVLKKCLESFPELLETFPEHKKFLQTI